MHHKTKTLTLSGTALLERDEDSEEKLIEFCTNKRFGFETTDVAPFEFVKTTPANKSWSPRDYQVLAEFRHTIDHIHHCEDKAEVKGLIVSKFEGDGGPCIGYMRKGLLAERTSTDREPYKHPPGATKEVLGGMHSVLIVGVDIDDLDPLKHFCEIKCAWGQNWGKKGFTNVGFEVFEGVVIPYHPYP